MNESTDNKASGDAGPSPARSIARTALATIFSEADFLQRMCDGQAYNIRKMTEELESLRRMNDQQADTIARKTEAIAGLTGTIARLERQASHPSSSVDLFFVVNDALFGRPNPTYVEPRSTLGNTIRKIGELQREAAFGRKMAAVAGVNIA